MNHEDQIILSLLTAVSENSRTTQIDLSKHLGIGVSLVNSYLKRVIYKGYVKTRNLQRRRLLYLVTPRGIKEKSRLTLEFLHFSYQYIRDIRAKIRGLLEPLAIRGMTDVVLYGSGEIAELAYLSLQELNMNLVAIVDPNHAGTRCVDHIIHDTEWLRSQASGDILLALDPKMDAQELENLNTIAKESRMVFVALD